MTVQVNQQEDKNDDNIVTLANLNRSSLKKYSSLSVSENSFHQEKKEEVKSASSNKVILLQKK